MIQIATRDLNHLLQTYWYLAVFVFVAVESTGIPLPGETILLVAAIYAGASHQLAVAGVIAAAALGAILGDNVGYWVGREAGIRLLQRYGRYFRFDARKLKLAIYLFDRQGPKVVFFGRFVAVRRAWAAILAGSACMHWIPFFVFNAAAGILWATTYRLAGYFFGNSVHQVAGIVGKITVGLAVLAIVVFLVLLWRHECQWEAERALPGPLDAARVARGTTSVPASARYALVRTHQVAFNTTTSRVHLSPGNGPERYYIIYPASPCGRCPSLRVPSNLAGS